MWYKGHSGFLININNPPLPSSTLPLYIQSNHATNIQQLLMMNLKNNFLKAEEKKNPQQKILLPSC